MKFFVNFLSAFRIASAFVVVLTMLYGWPWVTFVLFALAAASDWFDGYLARKYNVCTKLGGVMDHIGDKLLVCNTLIMLVFMTHDWRVLVPVILMIARELYISGLREFLGTQKIEMPVPKARFSMGKIKTTFQMITIVAFLGLFVIFPSITPETSRFIIFLLNVLTVVGLYGLWISLFASLFSAAQYTRTFAQKLKQIK